LPAMTIFIALTLWGATNAAVVALLARRPG
jgi:hypothetical protein